MFPLKEKATLIIDKIMETSYCSLCVFNNCEFLCLIPVLDNEGILITLLE